MKEQDTMDQINNTFDNDPTNIAFKVEPRAAEDDSDMSAYAQVDDFAASYSSYDRATYNSYESYISNDINSDHNNANDNKAVKELINYYQQKEFALKNDLYNHASDFELDEVLVNKEKSSFKSSPVLQSKIKLDSSNQQKDDIRFNLANDLYSPKEIYGDDSYFEAVSKSPLISYHDDYYFNSIDHDLLKSASLCKYIQRSDVAFIDYLQRHFPLGNEYDQQVFNLLLLSLFAHMEEGDICINISSLQDVYDTIEQWDIQLEELNKREVDCQDLKELLTLAKYYVPDSSATIYKILNKAIAVGSKDESNSPLVFDLGRLYLRRYFNYELVVANYIRNITAINLDDEKFAKLRKLIGMLFVQHEVDGDINWQKVAASMASTSKFTVISGGPGTGKTTTVLRIILMLICLDINKANIHLCAPTGKAAARMSESILKQLKDETTKETMEKLSQEFNINSEQIKDLIPTEAVTVHSLIKTVPNHATPIYNSKNKLTCDVLVVDEVSMLDLALFAKLINAMPDECRLILLGDKDQLSSVEAGSVLSDLCYNLNRQDDDRISTNNLNNLENISGYNAQQLLKGKIANNVSLLQFSYRSKDVPQIGKLAKLVNEPLIASNSLNLDVSSGQSMENIESYLTKKQMQRTVDDLESISNKYSNGDDEVAHKTKQVLDEFNKDHNKAISLNLFEDFMRLKSNSSHFSHSSSNAEKFCLNFAKRCVARGGEDNYAQFLEYLEARNFTVSSDPKELEHIFKLMDKFRVLCSNHSGEFGDQKINELIEQEVKRIYLRRFNIGNQDIFFPGKIVLLTANDKEQGFVNGYVGFCAYVNNGQEQDRHSLKIIIPKGVEEVDGQSIMTFNIKSTMMLTKYDSGFAMSIHKSQGSEYDKVSIMLSKSANRVLNKELLYTGITRAKKKVELLGSKASLSCALGNSVQRRSGLVMRINNKN